MVTINADQSLYAVDIPRSSYNLYKPGQKTDALLEDVSIYKPDPKQHLAHDFSPKVKLPGGFYKISPAIRSQIGGPDGFYFGDISLSIHSEVIIRPNFNILAVGSIGLYNNFDELKLASDSILPHVRTDIVKYLKASKKSHITRLQANYFGNPYKSIYTKLSAGIFEPMFAGYGGEILYKPFGQSFADISKKEFGEGSFDKGFFFNLPIQVFFQEFSRGQTGFGLRPLTRDGAQNLTHAQSLWSTTYQANRAQIVSEWDGFYD